MSFGLIIVIIDVFFLFIHIRLKFLGFFFVCVFSVIFVRYCVGYFGFFFIEPQNYRVRSSFLVKQTLLRFELVNCNVDFFFFFCSFLALFKLYPFFPLGTYRL